MITNERASIRKSDNFKIGDSWVKNITLGELSDYKDETFNIFAKTFCARPFDIAEVLYEVEIDYESLSKYDLFNSLFYEEYQENKEFQEFVNKMFLLEEGSILVPHQVKNEFFYFNSSTGVTVISERNIGELESLFKKMFGYENRKEEKFINKMTKEAYLEDLLDMRKIENKMKKSQPSIFDTVEAIVRKTSYTYETIWSLTFLQYNLLLVSVINEQEFKNVMTGIYSGTIDSKSINLSRFNWLINKD